MNTTTCKTCETARRAQGAISGLGHKDQSFYSCFDCDGFGHKNPISLSELKDRLRWVKLNLQKSEPDYNNDFHYEIEYASFSDHWGRMVERANSRYLHEMFSFVTLDTSGMGTVYTVIQNTDIMQAIFSDDFPEFMVLIDSLSDYLCLDDELFFKMEQESISEAWKGNIADDFISEIVKAFQGQWDLDFEAGLEHAKSDLTDLINDLSEDQLYQVFTDLCDESGRHPEIETGGNVGIDLEKLVESLDYKILLQIVSGIYFVKPDAVQIVLNLKS